MGIMQYICADEGDASRTSRTATARCTNGVVLRKSGVHVRLRPPPHASSGALDSGMNGNDTTTTYARAPPVCRPY